MNFLKNKKTAQALSVAAISLVALTACGGGAEDKNANPSASASVTATATATTSDTVASLSGQVPEGLTNDKDNLNETEKKSIETFTKYTEKVYEDKDKVVPAFQSMVDEIARVTASQPETLDQLLISADKLPDEEKKALADKLVELFPHSDFFNFDGMTDEEKIDLLIMLGSFENELVNSSTTLSDFKVTDRSGVYQDDEGSVYLIGLGTKATDKTTGETLELAEETWFEIKVVNNGEKISGQYWFNALTPLSSAIDEVTGSTDTEPATADVTAEATESAE